MADKTIKKNTIETLEDLELAMQELREAQKIYATYTQEQVDAIFKAAATAANKARIPLSKMAVAETGMGVMEAASEQGVYAIGVDTNQDDLYPGSVFTSMTKKVDNCTYQIIQSVVDGTFEGGTSSYMDLAHDGVGLTDFAVIKESLGDQFPQDIADKVEELKEKIVSGEIVVDSYEGYGKPQQ